MATEKKNLDELLSEIGRAQLISAGKHSIAF